MEILIRLDETDKNNWQVIKDLHNKLISLARQKDVSFLNGEKIKLANLTSDFWHQMIEKYPYLKNKKIAINSLDGYVFSYNSLEEFQKYCR